MPNILQYDQLEREIKNKMDLDDIDAGELTRLKSKLVKSMFD